jgi:hypothetical protein
MSTEVLLASITILIGASSVIVNSDPFERYRKPSRLRHRIAADLAIVKDLPEGAEAIVLKGHVAYQVRQLLIAEKSPGAPLPPGTDRALQDIDRAVQELRRENKWRNMRRSVGFFVAGIGFAFFILLV